MPFTFKYLINGTLKRCNLALTNYGNLQQLIEQRNRAVGDIDLLSNFPDGHSSLLLKALPRSKSQLRQDLFVLSQSNFKRGGFFVEFGAANGVELSNTHLLEKEYGWSGILAEPARRWHSDLKKNRDCFIETDCVWRDSNSTLTFNEAALGEFSTIDSYSSSDSHWKTRRHGTTYEVKTISLGDLLEKYNAPRQIDYLSIDTEGSEYEILSNFDFDKYQIKIITCEHNYEPQREKIASLLTGKGYVLSYQNLSQFDDWYVRPDLD